METFRKKINSDIILLLLGLFFTAFGVTAAIVLNPVAWFLAGVGALIALYGAIWGRRWVEFSENGITTQYLTNQDEIPWSEVKQSDFQVFERNYSMGLDLRNGKRFSMAVERKEIPKLKEWIETRATLEPPPPVEKPAVDWLETFLDWAKPVFLVVLGAFLAWISVQMCLELYNGSRATNWPTTEGTVVSSSVKRETKTSGRRIKRKTTYYKPVVEYEYSVDGKPYQGERISFSPFSTTDRNEAYEFSNQLFAHPEITVRYDPADPGESVLLTGVETNRKVLAGVLILGSLAAIGFGCYHFATLGKSVRA